MAKKKIFNMNTATANEIYLYLRKKNLTRSQVTKLWANEKSKRRLNVLAALRMLIMDLDRK